MLYVTGSGFLMNRLAIPVHESGDKFCQFIYGYPLPGADVEDSSSITFGGENIGLCSILHESEIPGLLAIAEDDRLLTLQDPVYEPGDNRRILRSGILPWTVDIEVSEYHGLQSIQPVEDHAV